jgi:hypothetical protein
VFIREQFGIEHDSETGQYTIECRHCQAVFRWQNFNATKATEHIVFRCPLADDEIKAQAQNKTQVGTKKMRLMEQAKNLEKNIGPEDAHAGKSDPCLKEELAESKKINSELERKLKLAKAENQVLRGAIHNAQTALKKIK